MRDKIYYYNHKNVLQLTLNEYPYFSEPSDLFDWVWDFNDQFGRLNTFRRNKDKLGLNIVIDGDYAHRHNDLCDIFNADVLANKPGYLLLNGWKLYCYIIEAENSVVFDSNRKSSFVVKSINSTWIRESTTTYNGTASGGGGGDEDLGRDYTFEDSILGRGYNYGYNMPESHYASIDLPGTSNGFEAIIYGPQVDPVIYLNNEPVRVFVTLEANQRLRIVSDGSTKTIEILEPNGASTDAFVYRDKDHTPFLTLGQHTELTFGSVRFEFTVIERRSQPTWN